MVRPEDATTAGSTAIRPLAARKCRAGEGSRAGSGCRRRAEFPFYDPTCVLRVEAIEPDEAMLSIARRRLEEAPVPITLIRAQVKSLPFPDAQFETIVVTLVFSVQDSEVACRAPLRQRGALALAGLRSAHQDGARPPSRSSNTTHKPSAHPFPKTAPDCIPLFTSDGLNLYFYAFTAQFGHWLQVGRLGRHGGRWQVATGLIYGQVKKSYQRRKLVRVTSLMWP